MSGCQESPEEQVRRFKALFSELDAKVSEVLKIIRGDHAERKPPVFPESLAELVTISDMGVNWEVRPRAFLNPSTFAELAGVIRGKGGVYVSAGKASHFVIPK